MWRKVIINYLPSDSEKENEVQVGEDLRQRCAQAMGFVAAYKYQISNVEYYILGIWYHVLNYFPQFFKKIYDFGLF